MRKIIALVTLYNPRLENIKNVNAIAAQVDNVFVCENTGASRNKEIYKFKNNVFCIYNEVNMGLSNGFNSILRNKSFDFSDNDLIIFFDQDSIIQEFYISNFVKAYDEIEAKDCQIGALGPVFYDSNSSKTVCEKKQISFSQDIWQVSNLITSSMLCNFRNLKSINFWNEEIFLDLSDWDLCWRLKKDSKRLYQTNIVILKHSLGEKVKKIGFFTLRVGKPFRIYYQTRDCLYLLKKKYVPFRYKIRFLLMLTIRPALYLIFLPEKKKRIHYFLKGISDFQKNIHGALEEKLK